MAASSTGHDATSSDLGTTGDNNNKIDLLTSTDESETESGKQSEPSNQSENNGFGNAENGLSLTEKGLRYCYRQMVQHPEFRYGEKLDADANIALEWKEAVDPPKTAIENALAGCGLSLADIEINGTNPHRTGTSE